jgi:hypothetical protein
MATVNVWPFIQDGDSQAGLLAQFQGGENTRRASADDQNVETILHHHSPLLVFQISKSQISKSPNLFYLTRKSLLFKTPPHRHWTNLPKSCIIPLLLRPRNDKL